MDMLGAHLHQFAAVPHDGARRANLILRPKRRPQQSDRVQILQPLAIMPVGTPPRHVFHVPGVYQARLKFSFFQNLIQRNPVNPRRLHGRGGDVQTLQPFGQPLQIFGECRENANRLVAQLRSHCHPDLTRPDVDTGGARVYRRSIVPTHSRLLPSLASFSFSPLLSHGPLISVRIMAGLSSYEISQSESALPSEPLTTALRYETRSQTPSGAHRHHCGLGLLPCRTSPVSPSSSHALSRRKSGPLLPHGRGSVRWSRGGDMTTCRVHSRGARSTGWRPLMKRARSCASTGSAWTPGTAVSRSRLMLMV